MAAKLSREERKQILAVKEMVEQASKADCNEAETRRRIERIFEQLLGYDPFRNITREHSVRGAGESEYCDFAVIVEEMGPKKPYIMVEIKRVNVDLAPKHLNQVAAYAINTGCEWLVLTNSKEWRLYRVTFGKPPELTMIESWNVVHDDPVDLAAKFELLQLRCLRKGQLEQLWQKRNVLTPRNLLGVMFGTDGLNLMRREIRKQTGVAVPPEEIVAGVRRLLNENALRDLEGVKVSLASVKPPTRAPRVKAAPIVEPDPVPLAVVVPLTVDSIPEDEPLPAAG